MSAEPSSASQPVEITFGCVLATDDPTSRHMLEQLCLALGAPLGLVVRAQDLRSPASLAQRFGSGDVDLVWASPTLALLAPELRRGVPMVRSIRQGTHHYHGVLFVRQDSTILSPMQLRGSRVAWVASTSASGYIFPRVALAGNGLDPDGLFSAETFYDSHGDVAAAVLRGDADVGATYAAFEDGDPTGAVKRAGFLEVVSATPARILLISPPIPADLVVATEALAATLGERLVQALQSLGQVPHAREALQHVLGADGLVRCDERVLEELKRQVADAEALGLLRSP